LNFSTVVFGPINSRRFGISLGVDLSPNIKQCNFDCLYCELGKEHNRVSKQMTKVSKDQIISDILEKLDQFKNIDVLTFTANGEPTLYEDLNELMTDFQEIADERNIKTLILSNSSTIWMPNVKNAILKFNKVKLSLDCATNRCFQQMDRPMKGIRIDHIKDGIAQFSEEFQGELYIEILFIDGINNNEAEIEALNKSLLSFKNIYRIDIGTIERPPAYPVRPVTYEELYNIAGMFHNSLPIYISKRKEINNLNNHENINNKMRLSKTELLHALFLRPLTRYDLESLFDHETAMNFDNLLNDGLIEVQKIGNIEFYRPHQNQN